MTITEKASPKDEYRLPKAFSVVSLQCLPHPPFSIQTEQFIIEPFMWRSQSGRKPTPHYCEIETCHKEIGKFAFRHSRKCQSCNMYARNERERKKQAKKDQGVITR